MKVPLEARFRGLIRLMTKPLLIILAGLVVSSGGELTNQMSVVHKPYATTSPNVIWGEVTNFLRGDTSGRCLRTSLRSGIAVNGGLVRLSGDPLTVRDTVQLYLENCSGPPASAFPKTYHQGVPTIHIPGTNWVVAFMPPTTERVEMAMTDTNGAAISRTSAGLATGQQPTVKPATKWIRLARGNHRKLAIPPEEIAVIPLVDEPANPHAPLTSGLNPARYFALKATGLYRLTVALRLYVMDTNSYVRAITFPPVTVNVRVE